MRGDLSLGGKIGKLLVIYILNHELIQSNNWLIYCKIQFRQYCMKHQVQTFYHLEPISHTK